MLIKWPQAVIVRRSGDRRGITATPSKHSPEFDSPTPPPQPASAGSSAEILTPRPAAIVDKAGCKAAGYWPLAGGRAANRSVPTIATKNAAFAAFGAKMVGTRRFELRTP